MAPRRKTMLLIGMTMAILVLAYSQNPTVVGHRMAKFTSQDELQSFLVDNSSLSDLHEISPVRL